MLLKWSQVEWTSLCPPDGSDGPGGGGGFLPLLAASPRGAPVGRVRDLPAQPGLLRAPDRRPLLGVQQLVRQPRHLRFPVGELPQGLQAGVPLSAQHQQLAPQGHQGDAQQGRHPALHQLHQRLRRGWTHPGGHWVHHAGEWGGFIKVGVPDDAFFHMSVALWTQNKGCFEFNSGKENTGTALVMRDYSDIIDILWCWAVC